MLKTIQKIGVVFLIFLIIGIALRFVLIQTPGFRTDIVTYQSWAGKLVEGGPSKFYSTGYFADYFPGYLYILWMMGKTFNLLVPNIEINSISFEYFIKTITNIFDLLTVLIIFLIIKKYSKHIAIWGALVYLFNPAVIFNSSVWGQTDGIVTFFIILSFYLLLEIQKYWYWILAFATSLLVKPQAAGILPIMYFSLFWKQPFSKFIIGIFLVPITTIILAIPFFISNPIFGLFQLSQNSVKVYPYTSLYAFNFWGIVGFWLRDDQKFLGITYQYLGTLIFSALLIFILIKLFRSYKNHSLNNYLIYYAAAITYFGFFLFMTRMHERYLLPFFALFTIVVFMKKNYFLLGLLVLIIFIHLFNLWFVYFYYSVVFDNPNYSYNLIYETIRKQSNIFSILSLVIFVMIAWPYFRYTKIHDKKI